MSHYATLGVDKTATQSEIKKAYRKLSMQYHPDRGGDENKFKEIADAYAVVGDEQKRQQYDAMQDNPFANFGNMGGMDGNFGDIFNQFFGGQFRQQQQTRGSDIKVDMHISFEEAFHGCSKTFSVNGYESTINLKRGVKTGQKFRLAGKGAAHPFNSTLPPGDLLVTIHVQLNSEFIIDGGHGEGFCIGNIMKYAQRYGNKNGYNKEDLMKVIHYALIMLHVHEKTRSKN